MQKNIMFPGNVGLASMRETPCCRKGKEADGPYAQYIVLVEVLKTRALYHADNDLVDNYNFFFGTNDRLLSRNDGVLASILLCADGVASIRANIDLTVTRRSTSPSYTTAPHTYNTRYRRSISDAYIGRCGRDPLGALASTDTLTPG